MGRPAGGSLPHHRGEFHAVVSGKVKALLRDKTRIRLQGGRGRKSSFSPATLRRASPRRFWVKYKRETTVNVAIEIPDDIGRVLGGQAGDVSRAVLEAVAVEAYRSGTITPAQVQQMLGLRSRWETESFLRRAEAYHDYTIDDLERDIAAIRDASRQ